MTVSSPAREMIRRMILKEKQAKEMWKDGGYEGWLLGILLCFTLSSKWQFIMSARISYAVHLTQGHMTKEAGLDDEDRSDRRIFISDEWVDG